ncbi:hypothetical protein CsatB_000921 [Cannabis sativa]
MVTHNGKLNSVLSRIELKINSGVYGERIFNVYFYSKFLENVVLTNVLYHCCVSSISVCIEEFVILVYLRSTVNKTGIIVAVKRDKFSSKLFYYLYIQAHIVDYARNIWDRMVLPKHRFIGWQIVNDQLLTRDNIGKFISITTNLCPVCCLEKETHHHLFVNCCFTRRVIKEIKRWCGFFDWPSDIREWLSRSSNSL